MNVFCARDIEAVRLETILYIRRLTGATAAPPQCSIGVDRLAGDHACR